MVVLKLGTNGGHRLGGSSGFLCWFWDEEFLWPKRVYGTDWFRFWFADLVRQGLGLLWFANLVGVSI